MNSLYQKLTGKTVFMELAGKRAVNGNLIDAGSDIVVLYNGDDFLYVPLFHVQNTQIIDTLDEYIPSPAGQPNLDTKEELSLYKILQLAKGAFVEIYIAGKQSFYGYITTIMDDYLVFYSPVYKMVYIPIKHLKWLIPYPDGQVPYGLTDQDISIQPLTTNLPKSFEDLLKKMEESLVIFNMNEDPRYIGKLVKIEDGFIELLTAGGKASYINVSHIQSALQV